MKRKSIDEVERRIERLEAVEKYNFDKHQCLHQIDMLSGEGAKLREKINKTKGEIIGLRWSIGEEI